MQRISYPKKEQWASLSQRPIVEQAHLLQIVDQIFSEVKLHGDAAIHKFTKKYDKVELDAFMVSKGACIAAEKNVSKELQAAIKLAKNNIETFHLAQQEEKKVIETSIGVTCWRESRAIEKVGIYIPGGSAPLFSTVLMLGIPALIAGCKEIILCTPPDRNGNVHPAILFTAHLLGIERVAAVGGIQAIAAMTFGTTTIPKVDKLFGPGNQFVTAAKQRAFKNGIAIDMPAGPSEVLIIADETAVPAFVAADLLSQAEHGADSQVVVLSTSEKILNDVDKAIQDQLRLLPRQSIAAAALKNSLSIVFPTIEECIEFSNYYAPEHLILAIDDYHSYTHLVQHAGSVFLGNYSCESAGDYASGPNHTLPTNGFARSYSGVSVDSFIKKVTFQEISKKGLQEIGPSIELMAEAEQLFAHKNAVAIRLKNNL
ncbi:MAG: histidinol dehydrogenase [Bacteroidota bacterium]|nr:histidinol dehydrogenase [Bacteroidota bacterium]